ncbi:MAG: hypothetical protein JXA90_07025 [Planctomycetes bacterium]|nr:hypothetical protein [Planctomycetota bacterium]
MKAVSLFISLLLLAAAGPEAWRLAAQPLEEFAVESGPPRFGESPRIQGNVVIWPRYSDGERVPPPGMIQGKRISRIDSLAFDIAAKPAYQGAIVLGTTHLFWGHGTSNYARSLQNLDLGIEAPNLVVTRDSDNLGIVAANSTYVILVESEVDVDHFRGTFFGKSVDDLENPAPDALRRIADYEYFPETGRWVEASDDYFVWLDLRPPDHHDPAASWKIFAKRAEDLCTPGVERIVADTGRRSRVGPHLALHGRTLLFEADIDPALAPGGQLYILDLDRGGEPTAVAVTADDAVNFTNPSVSEYYAVWLRMEDFFTRSVHGVRLEDGCPVGEPFLISDRSPSWVSISRNIAVWNGVSGWDGDDILDSVVAAELPLPGAQDLGDADQNGRLDLTDAVVILNYLFRGGWRPRLRPSDFDENGAMELTDAVRILEHLFGGPATPP